MYECARRGVCTAAALLIVGLAGCASTASPAAPYVGVLTGEIVDGRPLVRFPTIEVVGSRRSLDTGS
jgi:hypothetical protein